jgi:archaellum component FlaF (FlaF/FlaG flagellin family)
MTTSKRMALGFASVICAAIALMPVLVETGQLSAAPQSAIQAIQVAAVLR